MDTVSLFMSKTAFSQQSVAKYNYVGIPSEPITISIVMQQFCIGCF